MRKGDRYTLKSGHKTTTSYRANVHKQFMDFSVVHRNNKRKVIEHNKYINFVGNKKKLGPTDIYC